ncbi:MAG: DNA repair protein RecN [Chloroflexi bacterium]|nr:DNA repair protein RecN [Chloroflexota bacterium]MCY3937120.1 DNA repair protein RecN [Chloroflexota bacterium]
MLANLHIRDFALIEEVTLEFGPRFNVVTGETGAGKSIIIDAISLLLGARASPEFIRKGADSFYVEGIFTLDDSPTAQPVLAQLSLETDEGQAIISREQTKSRSTARIDGKAVPLRNLQSLGPALVDIHGQSEQLSLLRPARQLELLDEFARLTGLREETGRLARERREIDRKIDSLRTDERKLAREADLLRFQIEEIESAGLDDEDESRLNAEHTRLANSRRLAELAGLVEASLSASDTGISASDAVGRSLDDMQEIAQLDGALRPRLEQLEAVSELLDELAGEMRDYAESVESDPERLQELESRLELLATLKHKYGNSIGEVIEFGESAREQLARIEHSDEERERLEARRLIVEEELSRGCAELSKRRRSSAAALTKAMLDGLEEVGMKDVRFDVDFSTAPDSNGIRLPGCDERVRVDESGVDRVSFLIAPNPGVPARPVANIASGGETSRIMLALKAALGESDRTPTLIFDEVEQGVGGRNAMIVGQKLALLSRSHQVLCVTHLPQVAAFADTHFYVEKTPGKDRTTVSVQRLGKQGALEELAQMAGSGPGAERSAGEMLRQAEDWKAELARA